MKHITQLILILIIAVSPLRAQQIILPIEVLGAEGKVVTRTFNLSTQEVNSAVSLWLQVNNLSYQNKASIKINSGAWLTLNHQTVNMQAQEKARGGMVHGGFNTVRFSVPATGLVAGSNTISFRFDLSDAISNGYRVVRFNLLDAGSNKILAADRFKEDDPSTWVAPYTDVASIAEGKNLWYNGVLKSNYLPAGRKGFWYSAELKPMELINAKCSSCHTQDGRDLEIFSYSNESIVERSKFHMLTEDEGKKIASYIRSLSNTKPNVGRWGRPWNPPYQPGPKVATMPVRQWAAGAGLDAVLDEDKDMVPYMFPNGVNQEEVYKVFDSEKSVDRTILPLAIQFPDWKHWLPIVHPMDAYNKNNYYLSESTGPNNPNKNYKELRTYLETYGPQGFPNKAELLSKIQILHNHFRFFVEQGGTKKDHWRTADGDATKNLNDGVPREMAATSLARLFAVKNFEIVQEFEIESKAALFNPNDQVQPRQWPGDEYNVFEVPPHFQACVNNNCNQFMGQPTETGMYESTNWYQLQMVINGGDGFVSHNSPVDYNYHPDFVTKACNSSGVNEPMRYYHSMNVMYQTRTWSKGNSPNTGKGFRIRVMGPWNIYGITDGNQFNGFAPGEFAKTLDNVEPGMTAWVMNAMLRQFLTEVNKPHNSLSIWNRTPDGDDNTLDRADKTYADIVDALQRTERQEGFFYHYAAKMYYYIPRFQKLGVDCQTMEEVIDWCQRAWPLIDWHVFSNKGEMQLSLLLEDEKFCSATNKITAVATNVAANTVYNWKVNGVSSSATGNELSTDNLKAGDVVTCQITNNTACLANKTVTAILVMPSKGYNLTMRKVGEPTFKPLESMVACTNDQVELKMDIDIKPKQWLDAMDVNVGAEPANNSFISSWRDKSGNNFNADANKTELQPRYVTNAMNGLPAIVFGSDNNADGLELFSTAEDDFMANDFTILFVGQSQQPVGNTDWRDIIGNKTEGANGWFFRVGNTARVQVGIGPDLQHGQSYNFNRSYIVQITKKGDVITTYLNGQSDRVITKGANVTMLINDALYLGQSSGGNGQTGRYHKGPISELLVFESAITDAQKEFLEGYLTNKWKVNNELVYTHPYYRNSPFDITLNTPDGGKYKFDAISTSQTINLDQVNKFGAYNFIKEVCGASIESISITNCSTTTAPVVSSAGTATGTKGTAFTYTINASNTPTSYGATGLPAGLIVNTTSGIISGTPTTAGTFSATVSATNSGGTGSKAVVITISNPVTNTPYLGTAWAIPGTIQAENYDDGGEGVAYHDNEVLNQGGQQRTTQGVDVENTGDATGTHNVGWTAAGEWLKYTVNVATTGTYTLQVRVASPNTGKSLHVEMDGATIATVAIPNTTGWQVYQTVTVNTSNITAGSHVMRIYMDTDGFNLNYVIFTTTTAAPVVSSAATASGTTGSAFTYNITASNAPTSYGATGLPAGLSVNTSTGVISGTPTSAGTFNANVTAINAGGTGSKALTITIAQAVIAPVVSSAGTATGTTGSAFTYTITASNTPTSYGATGLPAGLTVNTTTGLINGTPTVSGTFNATVSAINAAGTGTKAVTITINPTVVAPVVSSVATASGTVGTAFSYTITASNTPTSYGATGLPAGLSVNTSTGLISGTPTTAGTFNATVTAVNSAGTGSKAVTITVAPSSTQFTLTTNATNGSITKSPNASSYASGTVVQLTAVPNSGFQFTSWSGGVTGSTNAVNITMDANKSVTANFTAVSSTSDFCLEAESALGQSKFAPYQVLNDGNASGGQCIVVPNGTGNQGSPPSNSIATYTFNVTQSGTYYIWMRVLTPTSNDNSLYVATDGGSYSSGSLGTFTTWTWKKWSSSKSFSVGTHSVSFARNHDGLMLDKIIITKSTNTPSGNGCTVATRESFDEEPITENLPASVILSPNPVTSGIIQIEASDFEGEVKVTISNEMGVNCHSSSEQVQSTMLFLNVSQLNAGVYFIQLQQGNKLIHKKFVVLQ